MAYSLTMQCTPCCCTAELLPNQDMESSIKDWCIGVGHAVPAAITVMKTCTLPAQQQAADKKLSAGECDMCEGDAMVAAIPYWRQ